MTLSGEQADLAGALEAYADPGVGVDEEHHGRRARGDVLHPTDEALPVDDRHVGGQPVTRPSIDLHGVVEALSSANGNHPRRDDPIAAEARDLEQLVELVGPMACIVGGLELTLERVVLALELLDRLRVVVRHTVEEAADRIRHRARAALQRREDGGDPAPQPGRQAAAAAEVEGDQRERGKQQEPEDNSGAAVVPHVLRAARTISAVARRSAPVGEPRIPRRTCRTRERPSPAGCR